MQKPLSAVWNEHFYQAPIQGRRHGGGVRGRHPHSDYPAPSLKMSVKIDFIYEI